MYRTGRTRDDNKLFAVTHEQEMAGLNMASLRPRRSSLPAVKLARDEDVPFNRGSGEFPRPHPVKRNITLLESAFRKASQKTTSAAKLNIQKKMEEDMKTTMRYDAMLKKFQESNSRARRRTVASGQLLEPQFVLSLTGRRESEPENTSSGEWTKKLSNSFVEELRGISNSVGSFMEKMGFKNGVSSSGNETDHEDIDSLVSLYGTIAVDSGYSDCYLILKRQSLQITDLGLKLDTVEIQTSFCHSRNIFHFHLCQSHLPLSVVRAFKNKKVYVKIYFLPRKIQKANSKPKQLERSMQWNLHVKFKNLTMYQLETGVISIKFYVPSRFGFSKTCIAKAQLNLKRHDYRVSNKISLILEPSES